MNKKTKKPQCKPNCQSPLSAFGVLFCRPHCLFVAQSKYTLTSVTRCTDSKKCCRCTPLCKPVNMCIKKYIFSTYKNM